MPLNAFSVMDDDAPGVLPSTAARARPRPMTDDAAAESDEHWDSDVDGGQRGSDLDSDNAMEESASPSQSDLESDPEQSDLDDPAVRDGMLSDTTPAPRRNRLMQMTDSSGSDISDAEDPLPNGLSEPLSAGDAALAERAKQRQLAVLKALSLKMPGEEVLLEQFAMSVNLSVNGVRKTLRKLELSSFIDSSGARLRAADPVRVANMLKARDPSGQLPPPLGQVKHLGRWRSVLALTARKTLSNGMVQGHVRLSSHHHTAVWINATDFDDVGMSALIGLADQAVPDKRKSPRRRSKKNSQFAAKQQRARHRQQSALFMQKVRADQTEEQRQTVRDYDAERKRQLREKNKAKRKKKMEFPKDVTIGDKSDAIERTGMWDLLAEQEYKQGSDARSDFLLDSGEGNWADCLMRFRKLMDIGNIRFCACCSEMHLERDGKRYSLNQDNPLATAPPIPAKLLSGMQEKLVNDRRDDHEIQHAKHADRPGLQLLNGLTLCWRRFVTARADAEELEAGISEETEEIQLCDRCIDPLRRNPALIPARAMANNLAYLPVPVQLQDLRVSERNVIAAARAALWIVNLERHDNVNSRTPSVGGRSDKYHKFKKSAIVFPQDVLSIAAALPAAPDDLSDMLFVNFLKSSDAIPDKVQLDDCIGVRHSKVKAALDYMVSNPTVAKVPLLGSMLFLTAFLQLWASLTGKDPSEFVVNKDNLAAYANAPNNLPIALQNLVNPYSDFVGAASDGGGYVNNGDVDGDDMDIAEPFTYTGFVDPSGNAVTRQQLEAAMNARLAAARQGAPPPAVLSIPTGSKFLNGVEFFPILFPELFPDSGGLVFKDTREDDREAKLSLEEWADHLLRSADPRWREHAQFAFTVFNLIQKQRVFKSCSYALKTNSVEVLHATLPWLTEENIQRALDDLNNAEFDKGYHTLDDIVDPTLRTMFKEVFKQLTLASGKLELTDLSRKHQRKQIYARQINIGLPDLWLTINPGDVHSPLMLRLAGVPLKLDEAGAFWKDFPSRIQRQLVAQRNPVAVTLYCNMLMHAIIDGLFGFGRQDKTTHNIFGEPVRTYSFHSEEQDRGTLHYHGFVWLRNRPPADEFRNMLKNEAFQQRMLNWLETHVCRSEPQLLEFLRGQRAAGVPVPTFTPAIYAGGSAVPNSTAAAAAAAVANGTSAGHAAVDNGAGVSAMSLDSDSSGRESKRSSSQSLPAGYAAMSLGSDSASQESKRSTSSAAGKPDSPAHSPINPSPLEPVDVDELTQLLRPGSCATYERYRKVVDARLNSDGLAPNRDDLVDSLSRLIIAGSCATFADYRVAVEAQFNIDLSSRRKEFKMLLKCLVCLIRFQCFIQVFGCLVASSARVGRAAITA